MIWVVLVLGVLCLGVAIWVWYGHHLLRKYKSDSLIVFGKKGHGKSLLFSAMSRMDRKAGYLTNVPFNHSGEVVINPSAVSVAPNTWDDVLNGRIKRIPAQPFEGKPVYLDDAGVYLPNFADNTLKKNYPSMPIAFAVWRHLYDAPIYINSQDVSRAWKIIREQADGFIKARRFFRLGPVGIIRCTYFDRMQSAVDDVAPIKKAILNKFSASEVNTYKALHGTVKDFSVVVWLPHHRYDSRYFRKLFFGLSVGQDSDSALPAGFSVNPSPSPLPIDMPSKSQAPSSKTVGNSIESARSDECNEGSEGRSGKPFPSSFLRERD